MDSKHKFQRFIAVLAAVILAVSLSSCGAHSLPSPEISETQPQTSHIAAARVHKELLETLYTIFTGQSWIGKEGEEFPGVFEGKEFYDLKGDGSLEFPASFKADTEVYTNIPLSTNNEQLVIKNETDTDWKVYLYVAGVQGYFARSTVPAGEEHAFSDLTSNELYFFGIVSTRDADATVTVSAQ
jgi:hypothetical protein